MKNDKFLKSFELFQNSKLSSKETISLQGGKIISAVDLADGTSSYTDWSNGFVDKCIDSQHD